MFGTGTLGFTIITTVLSLLTYAIVFGLLHSRGNNKLVVALNKGGHAFQKALSVGTKNNSAPAQTATQPPKLPV